MLLDTKILLIFFIMHIIGMMVRVFAKWPWRPKFNPRSSHTKDSKNGT